MGYGALILATILVAGFIFVLHYPPARYTHKRSEGWHTYLQAGAWGFPFSLLSFFICLFIQWLFSSDAQSCNPQYVQSQSESFIISFSFFTPLLAFGAGKFIHCRYYGIPHYANVNAIVKKVMRSNAWYSWLIAHNKKATERQRTTISEIVKHDPFEKLIVETTNGLSSVMITLKSRKVYIGQITNSGVEHGKLEHISIIPFISGYRDKENFRVIKTVQYADIYKKIDITRIDEFSTVIPVGEIESLRLFDDEIYDGFQSLHPKESTTSDDPHTEENKNLLCS